MVYYFSNCLISFFCTHFQFELNKSSSLLLRFFSFSFNLVVGGLRYEVGAQAYIKVHLMLPNFVRGITAREENYYLCFSIWL
jgi:hypothetical protein